MPKRDREPEEKTDTFSRYIDQIQAAVHAVLLLDKPLSSSISGNPDPETAAAIVAAFTHNVKDFDYHQLQGRPDAKTMVETATKTECLAIVKAAASSQQRVMSYKLEGASQPSIPQLLNLARHLSNISLAEPILFLNLISELVEVCTVSEGTEVFLHVEQTIPFIRTQFNFETGNAQPKLRLLQMCNLLLRRLSRAEDMLLAGRIHLFLSQILPSTDRSAVNANGSVNDSHAMEIEDVQEGAVDTNGQPINVEFYKQFWSLQTFFQNPIKAVDPNAWLQVYGSIKAALAEFAKIKCTVASSSINSSASGQGVDQEKLTVKYLSSPKLLHLQLQDAGFRRHFLVQCLILLQAGKNRSGVRQETFRVKQEGDADDLEQLLYKELARTPQHGPQFAAAIKRLMQHEDQWSNWKLEGAQSFERPAKQLNPCEPPKKRQRLEGKPGELNLGNAELNKLWNLTPTNLAALSKNSKTRRPIPSLKEFLAPVIQEMDPEEMVEEQYKTKRDPVYKWSALRQVAQCSLHDFQRTLKAGQNLEVAVKLIFPDDVPANAELPDSSGIMDGLNSNDMTANSGLHEIPKGEPGTPMYGSPKDEPGSPKSEEEGELPMEQAAQQEGDVLMTDADPSTVTVAAPVDSPEQASIVKEDLTQPDPVKEELNTPADVDMTDKAAEVAGTDESAIKTPNEVTENGQEVAQNDTENVEGAPKTNGLNVSSAVLAAQVQ